MINGVAEQPGSGPARRPIGIAVVMVACLVTVGLLAGALPASDVSHGMDLGSGSLDTLDAGEPRGVHLSFTEDPKTTLTATWFTDGGDDPGTVVEYGPVETQLTGTATGTSTPNPEDGSLLIHQATMTGLAPGQEVFYRVGGSSGWSEVYSAQTAPEMDQSVRIASFADQGVTPPARDVTQAVLDEDPDLIVFPGDLSYAEEEWWLWDDWFEFNEPLFATTPTMFSIGNHEDDGPHGATSYIERVSLPGAELYYSFDYASIHFLVLQSTTTEAVSQGYYDEMVAFAQEDLQEAVERRADGEFEFIFVVQHHPIYSNHEDPDRQYNVALIPWQEQLLDRHDVDVLLVGHNHHYERSYPMVASVPTTTELREYHDPEGWIQLITGGGGRALYEFQGPAEFWPHTAIWAKEWHYTMIEVEGPQLSFEAITAGPNPGYQIDAFTLTAAGADAPAPVEKQHPTVGGILSR